MSRKTRTMYMHTLDGQPAGYEDRDGPHIYFADGNVRSAVATLVPTLGWIRKQQRDCLKDRIAKGFDADSRRYGYIRVEVPE